jgi:hypothetical protein
MAVAWAGRYCSCSSDRWLDERAVSNQILVSDPALSEVFVSDDTLVQWLIVSHFKVLPRNNSDSNNIGAEKNGYSNSANLLSFFCVCLWETEMMGWS